MQRAEELDPGYEMVFTVTEYYDGPRQGVANLNGCPHFYDCVFSEEKQNYSDLFQLTPISRQIFDLAIEDWAIWERWESAYHQGKADSKTHPALPEDRARHDEIEAILNDKLKTNSENCVIRVGTFAAEARPELPKGVLRPLQVKWDAPKPGDERYGYNTMRISSRTD